MNLKLAYLFLLGVSLFGGYLAGRAIAKRVAHRLPGILLVVTGAIVFLIGQVETDYDHRFRLLAIAGLSLKIAGLVSVFSMKRTLKDRSVDLWAPQK